jgi:hypothetical protein
MKTLYFIASMEDLRLLTADATAATDVELRKDLISISSYHVLPRASTPPKPEIW